MKEETERKRERERCSGGFHTGYPIRISQGVFKQIKEKPKVGKTETFDPFSEIALDCSCPGCGAELGFLKQFSSDSSSGWS
jgi:rubredoxin